MLGQILRDKMACVDRANQDMTADPKNLYLRLLNETETQELANTSSKHMTC